MILDVLVVGFVLGICFVAAGAFIYCFYQLTRYNPLERGVE